MNAHRSRILIALTIIVVLVSWYLVLYEPAYRGAITREDRILVYAHRGFGNHAPDNSLEGAKIALSEGFDGVDVDAQLTKDGRIAIFHDVSLERFTTGEGRIDSKTLEELQAYDLGEKYGNGFRNVRIRSFEDFVAEVTPTAMLMVELKVATPKDTGIERRVNEILTKYQAYDRVLISSFNPVVLYRLKQIDPRIRTVFIFMDTGWDPKRVAETKEEDRVSLPWYLRTEWSRAVIRKLIRPDALSINHEVDPEVISKLIDAGYPVFLWPVNDESAISGAIAEHPYGLVTDEPRLAKRMRDAAN